MAKYKCNVCNTFEYSSSRGHSGTDIKPSTKPADFPDDWKCPICQADKTHLVKIEDKKTAKGMEGTIFNDETGQKNKIIFSPIDEKDYSKYLGQWERGGDDIEKYMKDIHKMSVTGESIIEPMRTKKPVISWDNILFKGAQMHKFPLNEDEKVSIKTIIGPMAKHPLEIESPVYITHMSFGALSRELKIILARGSAAVKTAMCSGEGGILPESMDNSYKYIFEYVPNEYSVTDENLQRADAIEIKIGQSAKPGMGGHLPAEKVTEEIAGIRGFKPGTDIASPARYKKINNKEDLKNLVDSLRARSKGRPIGIKFAAGHIENDLQIITAANPDFITIDGRPGSSGAAPKYIKDSTSIPTIFALNRARKFFDKQKISGISLVITGGFRVSSDIAKALALGADAVAIGTAALIASACQQYRICHTGNCPVGVATQDQKLRNRLRIDISAKKLENYLNVIINELKQFSRLTGNNNVHALSRKDICTDSLEINRFAGIEHV